MRIFVSSAAELLTDHQPHGEGLIAWDLLTRLAGRGHQLVVCGRAMAIRGAVPFETVALGRSRWESLDPLVYHLRVRRALRERGGAAAFDVALWLFPQGRILLDPGPRALPLVVGPLALQWTDAARRPLRAGDVVRTALAPLTRLLERLTLRRARCLLVSIPEVAGHLPRSLRGRAAQVPFGIDPDRYPVRPLPAAPTVLFVGRLEALKRVGELLRAFAGLEDVRAQLVIAGDGPLRADLEAEAAQLGLADRVRFLGRVDHAEIPAVLAAASLLCLPSSGEPYGMVVLEAMAAGRAVVVTDSAGPRFLVDDPAGGLRVPADEDALGPALGRLLRDQSALERAGRHNRERVQHEFAFDGVLDKVERALHQACGPADAG